VAGSPDVDSIFQSRSSCVRARKKNRYVPFSSRAVYLDEHIFLNLARSAQTNWLFPQDTPGLFFGIAAICEAGTRKNDDGYFVEKACRLISDRYGLRAEEFDELSLGLLENAVRQYAHHANPTEVDRIIRSSASSRLDEVGATILDSMSYARFRALNTNDRARSIIAVTTK